MADRQDKTTTPKALKDVFFSDIIDNFKKHPSSGDIVRVINESAVTQSIKNLVQTDLGERPYQNDIGGDVRNALFEMVDTFAADALEDALIRTIRNNEQRVDQLEVTVFPMQDGHGYNVSIAYTILNSAAVVVTSLELMRIR